MTTHAANPKDERTSLCGLWWWERGGAPVDAPTCRLCQRSAPRRPPLPAVVSIDLEDHRALLNELVLSRACITELQEHGTAQVFEFRDVDRNRMVREFHAVAGQTIGGRPVVPDDDTVRFRLRLIAEEFFELLESALVFNEPSGICHPDQRTPVADATPRDLVPGPASDLRVLKMAVGLVERMVNLAPVKVDMEAFADATVDIDYVVEGTRVTFGLPSAALWREVQRANLAKGQSISKRLSDGKVQKPEGWVPPDIGGVLRAHGWAGP